MLRLPLLSLIALLVTVASPTVVSAQTSPLAERLSGRILLQVQEKGEAWYVDPVSKKRYLLGRPEDAYKVMRFKGLGIRHQELLGYLSGLFPARLAGRVLLDVESRGEAYYIAPNNRKGAYLGKQTDAFQIMRTYGLGITNHDLSQIPVAEDSATTVQQQPNSPEQTADIPTALESQVLALINAHRESKGIPAFIWNGHLADAARAHTKNMAEGKIAFSHDRFEERIDALRDKLSIATFGENVERNNASDPIRKAVDGWLSSGAHRLNIENPLYTLTGIGVMQGIDGQYYLTQIFIDPL